MYLHPEEIARSILQVLPQQIEVLKADLDQVRSEIRDLQGHREQVEHRVYWRRRAAQWAGLGLILLPWGILFRLTYWDLSWDVVVSRSVKFFSEQDLDENIELKNVELGKTIHDDLVWIAGANRVLSDGLDNDSVLPLVHATSQRLYVG